MIVVALIFYSGIAFVSLFFLAKLFNKFIFLSGNNLKGWGTSLAVHVSACDALMTSGHTVRFFNLYLHLLIIEVFLVSLVVPMIILFFGKKEITRKTTIKIFLLSLSLAIITQMVREAHWIYGFYFLFAFALTVIQAKLFNKIVFLKGNRFKGWISSLIVNIPVNLIFVYMLHLSNQSSLPLSSRFIILSIVVLFLSLLIPSIMLREEKEAGFKKNATNIVIVSVVWTAVVPFVYLFSMALLY